MGFKESHKMAGAQILVAVGDPGVAGGLAVNLESLGYAVTAVVSSPQEALKKAGETPPDLVLLDLEWLREEGKAKAVRQLLKHLPQKVLYLAADEAPSTLKRAKITHSFDYLRKDCDSRELATIIDMALFRQKLAKKLNQSQLARSRVRQELARTTKSHEAEMEQVAADLQGERSRHQWVGEATLAAERQRLYQVLDTLPAYVILLNPDYHVPFANREFLERFGAPAGRKCYEFLFGRTSPCPDCETFKVLQTNAPHKWEWTGPDGRNYQIYDFPFPDTGGTTLILEMGVDVSDLKAKEAQIRQMAAALRKSYEEMEARVQDRTQELTKSNAALQVEISERLWSEKKLKESEERYRSLVDLSPDAIAVQSQGQFLFVNPTAVRLFGANHYRALMGKAVADVIHPDYRELVSERICQVNTPGTQTALQAIKIVRLDGRVVDVEASGVGINYQGQPAVQVMMRDITARKEMAKSLEHQASFPRLNPNPVLEADLSGNIIYANGAALQALEKLDRENQTRAFLPRDLDDILATAAATGETVFYREVTIKGVVFGESISIPKELEVIRIYARDITPQKRAEKELRESLEKLQASEEELQVQNEELQAQAEELQAQTQELMAGNIKLKKAHAALRESREDLNRAQAVAHTGSWRLDVRKNELLWSDETYRIFGIPQGTALTYETFLTAIHPQDRAYVDREWTAALGGKPYDIEHRIVVGDTMKWVREKAELEFDLQGRLLGGFGTVQDITARKQAEEALLESENRYRNLFQGNLAVMLLVDPATGEIVDANPAACSFYGWSREELTSRKITGINLAPPAEVFEKMRQVAAGQESHFFLQHRLADGVVRDVEVYSSPLRVHGRTLLYSIIHDNTARKEAEDTLEASRQFLEIANRHIQMKPLLQDFAAAVQAYTGCEAVAIRILDEEGNIPYEAYTGFSEEFVASESRLCIKYDECLCINVVKGATDPNLACYTPGSSCYINNFSQVLATAPPGLLGKTRNVCHQFGYESVALIPIIFGGRILGLIHLADHRENMVPLSLVARLERIALTLGTAINRVRGEEERQRLVRELETEQARLQAIIASAPEAIVVADENGQILMTNPAADQLYAHPEGCVMDAPSCALFQFCQTDGTACVPGDQPLLRSAKEGETHRNVEMVLAWPDGRHRDLLVNTAPIRDREGHSSGAVGLFQDITQRKQTEEKVRKLNLELADYVREVSERTFQLEAANKELEAFSYSVSHDLRTPLRAIEGFARMLREDYTQKLDEEGLRLLEVIRTNTQIMSQLIDDLLALSRLGRQEIRAQEIDVGGLVTSVFGELRLQNPGRQMELVLQLPPPAFGDRNLINQVLINLLANAVKFTKPREKTIIEVSGWTEGKENIYSIKDNGVGFDMRYVEKIFGVFQRLHRREDFEGTGVGLAIVQRIISRHGGRVWASGKVNKGAVFYFALPHKGE